MPRNDLEIGKLIRLYRRLTLAEIAEKHGGTKQGLSARLRRAGVQMRPRGTRVKPSPYLVLKQSLDVPKLVRLYVQERRSVLALSKAFGHSYQTVKRMLESEGVELRGRSGNRKYPEIYTLEIDQSVIISRPHDRRARIALYSAAKRAKRRVSLNKIGENTFRVTRVE